MTGETRINRRKIVLSIGVIFFSAFMLLNIIAYMHAYKMSHFVDAGTRTSKPESLSGMQKAKTLLTGVTIPKPHDKQTPTAVGLNYDQISLTARDGMSLSAWYIKNSHSKGEMLLFHGYASCKARSLSEAKLFYDLGWDVLMVDFRGSGDSSGNYTTVGVKEAMDVAAAYDWVMDKAPDQHILLFGTSMGAVAILNAIDKGWVKPTGIILECPFDRLINTVRHRFEAMRVPSFPFAQLLVFWGGIQEGFNGFEHNPSDFAKSVSCPTLILHGANDPRVTVEEVKSIKSSIKGPSQLYIFQKSGHESYYKLSPDEYRSVVRKYLKDNAI